KTVNRDNARDCPNHGQYEGKIVNGVDANVLVGAFRFPENPPIAVVESAAKEVAATGAFALDAIRFGKWRD
ncbi:MAG TPA: hypothetical protein VKP67_18040, partial [Xanthobacteraceae bacterium]|nr:hypothetical protein [Xanthobacteraceae bacterium]